MGKGKSSFCKIVKRGGNVSIDVNRFEKIILTIGLYEKYLWK